MTERTELTAEEKAKPYAKYYYQPSAPPAAHHAAMLADLKPLDPAKADRIQDVNDLLAPGYTEGENGYCVMPDGSGYVALRHPMPGATPEMIDWWFAWHGLEICATSYGIQRCTSPPGSTRRSGPRCSTPPGRSPRSSRGSHHHVVEDIGGGVFNAVDISFLTPEDFGFDMTRFHSPNAEALAAANVMARGVDDPRVARSAGGLRPSGAQDPRTASRYATASVATNSSTRSRC